MLLYGINIKFLASLNHFSRVPYLAQCVPSEELVSFASRFISHDCGTQRTILVEDTVLDGIKPDFLRVHHSFIECGLSLARNCSTCSTIYLTAKEVLYER